jgi:hypothetical protein
MDRANVRGIEVLRAKLVAGAAGEEKKRIVNGE